MSKLQSGGFRDIREIPAKMVSVDCIRVGVFFLPVKTLFCHFSVILDFFFQIKAYSQNFILTQKLHLEENGPSEGTL